MGKLTYQDLKKDWRIVVDAANSGSDLTAVLLISSFLDATLATYLRKHLKSCSTTDSLLGPNGALGNAISKAQLCYCLNLIEKSDFQNIQKIFEIRNKFAHLYDHSSFENPAIEKLCSEIEMGRQLVEDAAKVIEDERILKIATSNKTIFIYSSISMCAKLMREIKK